MYLLNGIEYFYFIGLPVIGVTLLSFLVFFVIKSIRKKSFNKQRQEAGNLIILALGGRENVVSIKASGSRLSLVLNDYSLVEDDKLKELGVSSILKMSNKITLVIGQEAKDIENLFN